MLVITDANWISLTQFEEQVWAFDNKLVNSLLFLNWHLFYYYLSYFNTLAPRCTLLQNITVFTVNYLENKLEAFEPKWINFVNNINDDHKDKWVNYLICILDTILDIEDLIWYQVYNPNKSIDFINSSELTHLRLFTLSNIYLMELSHFGPEASSFILKKYKKIILLLENSLTI